MHVIEVVEALDDGFGNLAEDVDTNRADLFGDRVEGTKRRRRVSMYLQIFMTGREDEVYPQSMYSMHMTTSPSLRKAP